MKNRIILLIDYKNNFGSKQGAVPYRSGLDQNLLKKIFIENGLDVEFIKMSDILNVDDVKDKLVLYTSSEDNGYHYKSYIEDVVLHTEQLGGNLVPNYNFLRANNNKVYMELIRKQLGHLWEDKLDSWVFGTLEEMNEKLEEFSYPIVVKTASGALSRGVSLAKDENDLIKKVKSISRTRDISQDIKDKLRPYKHKDYTLNSIFRNKFILQSFIPNLKNDWKILIFGDKYFVLTRHVKKNDFRASGSHVNYLAGSKALLPLGLLDYAKKIFDVMKVPNLSLDVVYDGINFHLIEFQAVYFGTSTIDMCDVYFSKEEEKWIPTEIVDTTEKIYAESIVHFLKSKND
jgi:glutathione synthase/RimK-type ligase-like ATP-grasp enzyme